jgi:hypothetical protein
MTTDRDNVTDPVIAQLLREAADESPPAHVDAAILAEARRAAEPSRRIRSAPAPLWRWLLPLGAAATIAAIVISLQPLAPTPGEPAFSADDVPARRPDPSAGVNPTSAPPPSANASATAPAKEQSRTLAKARSSASAGEPEREPPLRRQETRKEAAAEAPVRASVPAPATPPAAAFSGAPAAAPAAVPAPARERAAARADAAPDAAVWIERIRNLLRESRREEAAQELERFRAAFADADARLPDDLRAFAAQSRVKRAAQPR